ncbi:MAG: transcription-repair coupling factor, partial [Magnetococcales bacterium]|nr:transcription-repair coupling factor [Magnetococcales bacterium]
ERVDHADLQEYPVPMERFFATAKQLLAEEIRLCISVKTFGQRERILDLLKQQKLPARGLESWTTFLNRPKTALALVVGEVRRGFLDPVRRIALVSDIEMFGASAGRRRSDRRFLDQLLQGFSNLNEEDHVVHIDHGIGRFGGLTSLEVQAQKNDFLLVTYAGDDKLYVPVENLDRVSKYSGGDSITLDKLGGNRWKKAKTRAKKKIVDMAEELIRVQALRATRQGFVYSGIDPIYQEFAAAFPYEETEDQAQAIAAVLNDMASPRPMDRLVCGDVGFGKTEVALRAAFRAVMDGRQVAILSPTTILAQQHYETFSKRLAAYPIHIGLLSRFRTPKQQKATLEILKGGGIEIVVGTHRLLQKDVKFRDLGLLVVDEEQRFGVTHKERIKKMRATVDILTLTATPIPRTMHMAMTGVRDISIIASPPADRLAIRTLITQYKPHIIREAILRELHRGGQVFYVHNRVDDIERTAQKLLELVPEATIGVAHGQMREAQLERIMLSFYNKEFNVLVCTTIIENGVDVASANTIIIHRADRFGLAQLHQLRGRVGRSRNQAYAYMLIPHQKALKEDARRRLDALESLGDLGSGFMLATHDLEIRGAGNILGEEQSGEIREVGFSLYNHMLKDAVKSLTADPQCTVEGVAVKSGAGETVDEDIVPAIHVHLSTYIPEEYVPDVQLRLSLYKRIAELNGAEELSQMRAELIDRFGPLPDSVSHLIRVMGIKGLCQTLRLVKVEAGPKGGTFRFHEKPNINPSTLIAMIQQGQGAVRFDQQKHSLAVTGRDWSDPHVRIDSVTEILQKLLPNGVTA